jgi:hypothetical protein
MKFAYYPASLTLSAFLFAASSMRFQPIAPQSVLASAGARYDLTASDLVIALKQNSATPLRKQIDALPPDRRLFLVFSNLQAPTPPGILYAIYLEPAATEVHPGSSRVGYLNFFSVSAGSKSPPVSFEVTPLIRALLSTKPDLTGLQVRIVPAGPSQSTPSIGNIELVARE